MAKPKHRVAYLVTHPIQYQAPLLRLISEQNDIDLTVFFQSDISLHTFADAGFGRSVKWDIPLVDGYRHEFLPGIWRDHGITGQRPISWGLSARLKPTRFDALWVHGYSRWVNWMGILIAKRRGLAVLVRDEATSFSSERSDARRYAKRLFFAILSRVVDAFLAIGSANRDYYLKHGIAADRIFSVPYCVDNEFFAKGAEAAETSREQLRRELEIEADQAVILYASKFQPRKRPGDLLRAYERLLGSLGDGATPVLLFLGDGELRNTLEAEARSKGFHAVRFLGFRNQTELPQFYALCDVFVLPSMIEPWGLAVNEVMATGKPVIVSDRVGCAQDLVRDGVNGYVFPAGNIDALAGALMRVIKDRDQAARMGIASREIIARWSFREDIEGLRLALQAVAR